MSPPNQKDDFYSVPAGPNRWNDLETLFGERGACGSCWCMAWRRTKRDFDAGKDGGNKRALKTLTTRPRPPGVLLFRNEEAVGWCSIAPREDFVRLERSRVWARIDENPVWSVSCFFVKKGYRNQGLSVKLLEAAVEFARTHGAEIVEGYPQQVNGRLPDAFVWTGLVASYERAGFEVVARRSGSKLVMRRYLGTKKTSRGGR